MKEMNEVEKFIISKEDFEKYFNEKSYVLKEDLIKFYNMKGRNKAFEKFPTFSRLSFK